MEGRVQGRTDRGDARQHLLAVGLVLGLAGACVIFPRALDETQILARLSRAEGSLVSLNFRRSFRPTY